MSDERKKSSGKWIRRVLAAVIAFVCYESVHYATSSFVSVIGADGVCRIYDEHVLGGRQLPQWAERYFFWPADRIDDLIRDRPWHQFRE